MTEMAAPRSLKSVLILVPARVYGLVTYAILSINCEWGKLEDLFVFFWAQRQGARYRKRVVQSKDGGIFSIRMLVDHLF